MGEPYLINYSLNFSRLNLNIISNSGTVSCLLGLYSVHRKNIMKMINRVPDQMFVSELGKKVKRTNTKFGYSSHIFVYGGYSRVSVSGFRVDQSVLG